MSRNKIKSRVKTSKRRKSSSNRWLERQINDPYVEEAKKQGYRSRAAFKLKEIDDRFGLLKRGTIIVDLGAAPGGWSQIAGDKGCRVIAIDLLKMDELPGVEFVQMDFMEEDAPNKLKEMLGGQADGVISDLAPNTTGHRQTDHLRIMAVVEAAYLFATEVLKPGGYFLAKVFAGGAENTLLAQMKKDFAVVKHVKPPASRSDSSEKYVIAQGFRGGAGAV
jgi:23S rRNA (uridine2552-2'-O)-methyltransferase